MVRALRASAPPPAPSKQSLGISLADLYRALDEVPLARVFKLANLAPLNRPACPHCRAPISVVGPRGWWCPSCFVVAGPASYYLMVVTGLPYHELHDAIDAGAELELDHA
jgi:hypothetical protein